MRLTNSILAECHKLIARHHHDVAAQRKITQRFQRSTGVESSHSQVLPIQWRVSPAFHPFKTRKRAETIAKAIEHAIREKKYSPHPALVLDIPKPGGGTRQISVFPVADAAVANAYFKQILRRNQSRLSPFSYAYRADIGAHSAIDRLWRETAKRTHYFLVEFDFSKYFDTIEHDYVLNILSTTFKLTRSEQHVVRSILASRRAYGEEAYGQRKFARCARGIPQGNSLSLFLANVACHELDLSMTRAGMVFARFADDIVVLCETHELAWRARELIMEHCSATGLAVNFGKSDGITEFGPSGLRPENTGSIKTTFDFLGHRFGYRLANFKGIPSSKPVRRLSIRPRTEQRMREKLGGIIYSHLLRYAEQGLYRRTRVNFAAGIDWDLVTCINDLRAYIYGGMPEDEITRALRDRSVRLHRIQGVMAYFPLVTDIEQLRRLDGWMVNAIHAALIRRQEILLTRHGVHRYPALQRGELVAADWYDPATAEIENDVRLPSLVRAWKYSRRCLNAFDLNQFPTRSIGLGDGDLY